MSGKPSVRDAVARAMYEAHKFKKPWDHPDTVRLWHPIMKAQATGAIAAYHKAMRATYTKKGRT
jgi:hypothetical protein